MYLIFLVLIIGYSVYSHFCLDTTLVNFVWISSSSIIQFQLYKGNILLALFTAVWFILLFIYNQFLHIYFLHFDYFIEQLKVKKDQNIYSDIMSLSRKYIFSLAFHHEILSCLSSTCPSCCHHNGLLVTGTSIYDCMLLAFKKPRSAHVTSKVKYIMNIEE